MAEAVVYSDFATDRPYVVSWRDGELVIVLRYRFEEDRDATAARIERGERVYV